MDWRKIIRRVIISVLVAIAVLYFFHDEITKFVLGADPSAFQKLIAQGIDFLASWFAKILGFIKSIILFFVDIIIKIVTKAKDLFGMAKGLADLITKLIKEISDLITLISDKISSAAGKL